MSGVVVKGDIAKFKKAIKSLSTLEFKKLNKSIGELLRSSTVERFKTGKNPDEKAWKPSKNAIANNRKTLLSKAILRNSISYKVNEKGVVVGTNTIYAKTHQFGEKGRTIRPRNGKYLCFKTSGGFRKAKSVTIKIPARQFLGISEEDSAEIKATVMDMVQEATE